MFLVPTVAQTNCLDRSTGQWPGRELNDEKIALEYFEVWRCFVVLHLQENQIQECEK